MKKTLRTAAPLLLLILLAVVAVTSLASSGTAVWPESPGTVREANGKLLVDASNADTGGYVMVCAAKPSKKAMKLRVSKGGAQLMYDIDNLGAWEVIPLQMGSGSYEISLFESAKNNKYSAEGKVTVNASLKDENSPFLVSNQYVNYTPDTEAVKKSDELCNGATGKAAFDIICGFIESEFKYDFVRAANIQAHVLPDIDGCYERRGGICQDLSAMMCSMLRVQGVPAKLVIGYADRDYHAWTVCVVDGKEILYDPTAAIGALDARTYTAERIY